MRRGKRKAGEGVPKDCIFSGVVERCLKRQGIMMELYCLEIPVIAGQAILGTEVPIEPPNGAILQPPAPSEYYHRRRVRVAFVVVCREVGWG